MSEKTKKILKVIGGIVGGLLLLIIILAVVYFVLLKINENDLLDVPQTSVSDNTVDSSPTPEKEQTQQQIQNEIDRTPKWDDYAERDYIEGVRDGFVITESTEGSGSGITEEDIADTIWSIIYNTPDAYAKWYDYSNGFIVTPTDNITPIDSPYNSAVYSTIDGSMIIVEEANSAEHSIESLRETELKDLNFWYHNGCIPKDIPEGTDIVLGGGLPNYWEYYEVYPEQDPTVTAEYQLCYDTTVDTYYGKATCLMAYNRNTDEFVGIANIQCDHDRILVIKVTSYIGDYVMPYILEVAANGIIMIE